MSIEGRMCRRCGTTKRFQSGRCVNCQKIYELTPNGQACQEKYRHSMKRKIRQRDYVKKYKQTPEGRANHLWNHAKKRANQKGLIFDITPKIVQTKLEIAVKKWRKIGIEFDYLGTKLAYSPSLDQIKAGQGYTLENIQIVPWAWNALKGNSLTDKEAIEFCKKIAAAH
jgi:hypothetical protein